MATLTVVQSDNNGEAFTWASIAAGGDQFINNGRTLVLFQNTGGSSTVATFDSPALVNGLTIENPAVTIAAGAYRTVGPFDPAIFNTAAGVTTITYSGAGIADTNVAVISA